MHILTHTHTNTHTHTHAYTHTHTHRYMCAHTQDCSILNVVATSHI